MTASAPRDGTFSVLIINDDSVAAASLATYLRVATDYRIDVVSNHDGEIRAALEHAPDVIICDLDFARQGRVQMAHDLVRQIAPKPLLIALGANAGLADALFAAGYDRYYIKPADQVEIETAIRLHKLELAIGTR